MTTPVQELRKIARAWDATTKDTLYTETLEELIFHASLRFTDYQPTRNGDTYLSRLLVWLMQAPSSHRRTLLLIASRILFLDKLQHDSLCTDAYRRIVLPWLISTKGWTFSDQLAGNFEEAARNALREYPLYSVTDGSTAKEFRNLNGLSGLPEITTLGTNTASLRNRLKKGTGVSGMIIFEDFVGSGRQTLQVLSEIERRMPQDWATIFLPLVALEAGTTALKQMLQRISVQPVFTISARSCVSPAATTGEDEAFASWRTSISATGAIALGANSSIRS